MFFILSKTLGVLTVPSNVITFVIVLGLFLLRTRFARAGRRLLAAGLVLVAILGYLPIGTALTLVLEQRFPRWNAAGDPPAGIIVLGGTISPEGSVARGQTWISESAERVTEVAALARRFPDARIVFSGGTANLVFDGPPESAFVQGLFESFGIPRSRVALEERSRNTAENARFTKEIVSPKPGERWLLVTSAIHMPRAVGAFRGAGFPVEAYPVDWRTKGWLDLLPDSVPISPIEGLRNADVAAKEWIGLLAYLLAGYNSEWLPGPLP